MPAIPYKKYPTSDKPWDGPANEANLKTGQDKDYYSKAYAWIDPKGDETTKSAYRFIHAEVDSDGNIGDTNIKACQSGIAVLNGAMGGTTIPDADRQGVYDHLAKHLKDAGVEPADLKKRSKPLKGSQEMRAFSMPDLQADDTGNTVEGHAAIYGQTVSIAGLWNETIARGAFDKTNFDDVLFDLNHDLDSLPLARSRRNTANSTLQLTLDDKGLAIRASLDVENNPDAKALYNSIKRGDISGMSFIFDVADDEWVGMDTDMPSRTIKSVGRVYEVAAVSMPAYPGTDISARGSDALDNARRVLENARSRYPLDSGNAEKEKREKEAAEKAAKEHEERRKRLILATYF